MSLERWFHDGISGSEAKRLLIRNGSDGSYLVRPSSTRGCYAFSVRKGQEVYHCKIKEVGGMFEICTGYRFESLTELINYYKSNPAVIQGVFGKAIELKYPLTASVQKELPQKWDPNVDYQKQAYVKVNLNIESEDHVTVTTLFHNTMMKPKFEIIRIERIQHPKHWKKFDLHRKEMAKESGGSVNEKYLFHGTKCGNVETIIRQNLDPRVSGANATAYGEGSYFAKNADYSHGYTDTDMQNCRYMFMARVLVGKYSQGMQGYRRPPPLPGDPNGKLYDSCVDDVNNPKIYVIFDSAQSYPEYLIHYVEKY